MTSGTIILDKSTAVILINATTLMHKSTLSTNDFGNNHFGQKYSSCIRMTTGTIIWTKVQ